MSKTACEVVSEFVGRSQRGERSAALELVAEDIEVSSAPSVPWGGFSRGRGRFAERAAKTREYIQVHPGATVRILDADEHVLFIFDGTATAHRSGRSFDHRMSELFTVEGGEITKIEIFYWDTASILEAIGTVT